MSQKVAVGMSGGVDSSVTAALLAEQGCDVTGVFIEAYNEPGCRTDEDKKDALQAALRIGIPFQSLDMRPEYKDKVVSYFLDTYKRGATPNPDVVCNREVKFGLFYDWAIAHGFDAVATGHYARMARVPRLSSHTLIQRAADPAKDQSYFLWQIPQDHLPRILWPLGTLHKSAVREKARTLELLNADKPDSMGVCMMGELSVREFLKNNLGEKPGDVMYRGVPIGTHRGLWFHTVGQRGGFDLDKKILKNMGYVPEKMEPLYVIHKDPDRNTLLVGERMEAQRGSFHLVQCELRLPESILLDALSEGRLFIRIRNLGDLTALSSLAVRENICTVGTAEPLFGVAEGQAAVLYMRVHDRESEIVVGGGEISV